jgi:hypothetical protein
MQQSQKLFDLEVQQELNWAGIEPVPNPVESGWRLRVDKVNCHMF